MIKNVEHYCGANLKKRKGIIAMMKVQAHNLRNGEEVELGDNIDKDKFLFNRITAFNGFDGIVKTYFECLRKCKKKPRKDHIKCLDYVFYRSDCFDNQAENDLFRDCAFEFFKSYFKDMPYIVYEHNDEKTQHFHVMVIPFDKKERSFVGSNLCGKRKDLIELQTLFAEYCLPCGLERGKEGSKNKNKSLKKYYEEENAKLEAQLKQEKEELEAKHSQEIAEIEERYKIAYDYVSEQLEHINDISETLDEKIQQKKEDSSVEELQKYKEVNLELYKALENTLKEDDGSEYFVGIRAVFEHLKNLLINMGLLHRNKEHEEER